MGLFGANKKSKVDTPENNKELELIDEELQDEEYASIGNLLDNIVKLAVEKKASDIHLEPKKEHLLIRYRLDGILQDIEKLPKKYEKALVFKIKVNAKLRTDEHFSPQDGRIKFAFNFSLDTRISIIPTTNGEKVVMRLLSQDGRSFKLEDLGYNPRDLEIIRKNYLKPYGTIIAAGPTGSGKTTSLYAILQIINSREKNVTTIEDPVEYEIDGVNHIQVNPKAGLTFEKGLRAILRQDPNVLMIGEIRDAETAEIAINAAMTGHLVLSTIHTNDALTTIPRLVDMGVEPFLVASALNVILAQRLGRRLCENCKQKTKLTKDEYTLLEKYRSDILSLIKPDEPIFKEQGCDQCGKTGYKGRIGLYEVLEITESIRKIIVTSRDMDQIYDIARKQGLQLIVEDGVSKLKQGILSLNELLRVTALKQ